MNISIPVIGVVFEETTIDRYIMTQARNVPSDIDEPTKCNYKCSPSSNNFINRESSSTATSNSVTSFSVTRASFDYVISRNLRG